MRPLCLRSPHLALSPQSYPKPQWLPLLPLQQTRLATHKSERRATNQSGPGPGARLGAKKAASQLVVPGNIIFRQRGTHWFPGENCDMGRDHTIFAKEKGYVCFYRDPELHPKRKYIGVVFERGMKLPTPRNKPRIRRLGMVGRERELGTLATATPPRVTSVEGEEGSEVEVVVGADETAKPQQDKGTRAKVPPQQKTLAISPGYQYRMSNWYIGRAAERAQVKVRKYKRGDRYLAWRKVAERKKRNEERNSLKSRKKKGSKNK